MKVATEAPSSARTSSAILLGKAFLGELDDATRADMQAAAESAQVATKTSSSAGSSSAILVAEALLDAFDDATREQLQVTVESPLPQRAKVRWSTYFHLGISAHFLALDSARLGRQAAGALEAWLEEPDYGGLDAEAKRDAVLATALLWDDAGLLARARQFCEAPAPDVPQLNGSTDIVRSELLRVLDGSDVPWDPALSSLEQAGFYSKYSGPYPLWFAGFAARCRRAGLEVPEVLHDAASRLDEELGDGAKGVVKDKRKGWSYVAGDGRPSLECRGVLRGDGHERTIRGLDMVMWMTFRDAWDQLEPIARGLSHIPDFAGLPSRKELDAIRLDPDAEIRIVIECTDGVRIAEDALRSHQARLDAGAAWLRARGPKMKCRIRLVADER